MEYFDPAGIVRLGIEPKDGGPSCTVICVVALDESVPSLAVSCRTYVPGCTKLAVVAAFVRALTSARDGPDTCDHETVNAAGGFGRPSSVAEPLSVAVAGSVIVWSLPALTVGAALT